MSQTAQSNRTKTEQTDGDKTARSRRSQKSTSSDRADSPQSGSHDQPSVTSQSDYSQGTTSPSGDQKDDQEPDTDSSTTYATSSSRPGSSGYSSSRPSESDDHEIFELLHEIKRGTRKNAQSLEEQGAMVEQVYDGVSDLRDCWIPIPETLMRWQADQDQNLINVRKACEFMVTGTRSACQKMLDDTSSACQRIVAQARNDVQQMVRDAVTALQQAVPASTTGLTSPGGVSGTGTVFPDQQPAPAPLGPGVPSPARFDDQSGLPEVPFQGFEGGVSGADPVSGDVPQIFLKAVTQPHRTLAAELLGGNYVTVADLNAFKLAINTALDETLRQLRQSPGPRSSQQVLHLMALKNDMQAKLRTNVNEGARIGIARSSLLRRG